MDKKTISFIRGWPTMVAKKEHYGIRKENMASLFFYRGRNNGQRQQKNGEKPRYKE